MDTNAGARGGGAMTLPERDNRRARAYAGDTDHDAVVNTFAIGYMGRRSMFVGDGAGIGLATSDAAGNVDAPVIGIRYWLSPLLGIDAGLGMLIQGGSGETNGTEDLNRSRNAFILHGGLPLALATSQHFTFQVIPEMNVGFSSFSQDGAGEGSGFHFDLGARAGAEVHFGFIGLPKLSLLATIGLAFAADSAKFEPDGGGEVKQSRTAFFTSVQDSPWNIFTSNVGALYYF